MNLRCTFHISPSVQRLAAAPARTRAPSVVESREVEEPPKPRGRSHETWLRARNWASED